MIRYLIGILLVVPFVLAMGVIIWHGTPDTVTHGDAALLEIYTRAALKGEQFTGPYSRFGFSHPGPVYFYLLAPLYRFTNGSALSLHLSALLLNVLAVIGMLVVVWRNTNRWTYLWWTILLMTYLAQIAPVFISIWNPFVPILGFLLSILSFSAVAAGKPGYLPLALFTSSFVVQTHLGYTVAMVAIGGIALLFYAFPAVRTWVGITASPQTRIKLLHLLLSCFVLLVLLWGLPVFEQFSHSQGNFSKILQTFASLDKGLSWNDVYRIASGVFSKYVMSVINPASSSWEHVVPQDRVPWSMLLVIGVQGVLLLLSYVRARQQHQDYFVALSLLCMALSIATIFSIKRVIGPILDYLFTWMTTVGVLIWFIIGSVLLRPLEKKVRDRLGEPAYWLAFFLILIVLLGKTYQSGRSFYREAYNILPHQKTDQYTQNLRHLILTPGEFLTKNIINTCVLRPVDRHLWPTLAGLALKLDKMGIAATIDPQWPAQYPPQYAFSSLPDGMLLFLTPYTHEHLQQWTDNLTVVAQTQDIIILWQPVIKSLAGLYSFESLPVFAVTYEGFSQTNYNPKHESYRWSIDIESTIQLPLEKGTSYSVALTVAIPQRIKSIDVFLNGQPIAVLEFPGEWRWQEFVFQFPAESVSPINTLTFRYVFHEPPEHFKIRNRRGASVAFREIVFKKIL